jgi:hypothetical protein
VHAIISKIEILPDGIAATLQDAHGKTSCVRVARTNYRLQAGMFVSLESPSELVIRYVNKDVLLPLCPPLNK